MYGALKTQHSAKSSRHNLKFFDSTDLASENANQASEINNNSNGAKIPAYFTVSNFLQNDNSNVSDNSILQSSKFGNLPIKINERNIRHNIKFFNSIEMQRNQSQQNEKKLPGYFQVNDALQTMDKNSKQATKLFI